MKKTYKLAAVLTLSSIFFLSACHKETSQNKPNQSSEKTSQTNNNIKKNNSGSYTNRGSSSTSSPATSSQRESGENNNQENSSSSINVSAIANGDFSSVAGTWQNANGDTLVFDNNGLVSDTQFIQSQGVSGEKALFTIGQKDSEVGSAALFMIPKGVASTAGATFNQDVITVGQGASSDETPYYKTS
ncbi:DUF6287 domain-containing protein [Streptococcus dentasini]